MKIIAQRSRNQNSFNVKTQSSKEIRTGVNVRITIFAYQTPVCVRLRTGRHGGENLKVPLQFAIVVRLEGVNLFYDLGEIKGDGRSANG
ncbi:MAG: hypothetical protein SCARUB_01007 [Candidatus Scalindua rubra]|uniref:Uncharacterized protein n=1 Tax=Candidatus Scalindua rubra TaxID=1872076 RepID=A0A1E3XDY6_9BACT|nr:MAG: hypothetical protein SCARUB_01007 [Candidatus Scalindua rubra]